MKTKKFLLFTGAMLIGTAVLIWIFYKTKTSLKPIPSWEEYSEVCTRTAPYKLEPKIMNTLNLLTEDFSWRLPIKEIENCLNIRFVKNDSRIKNIDTGAVFLNITERRLDNLEIIIRSELRDFSEIALASILSHEITHAVQHIRYTKNNIAFNEKTCYRGEAEAFYNQLSFVNNLKKSELKELEKEAKKNIDVLEFSGLKSYQNIDFKNYIEKSDDPIQKIEARYIRINSGWREQCGKYST